MKKIFTLVAAAVMALTVNAKDFTDNLAVTVTMMGDTQPTTENEQVISVEEVEGSDGLYNISITNFQFMGTPVGNIDINNIKGNSDSEGFVNFEKTETTIDFMKATVIFNEGCRMKGDKMYLDLDISVNGGMITVDVVFGDNNFPKEYTDKMTVDLGSGASDPMEATISILEQTDGKFTLSLKNFMFGPLGVGNITVADVEGVEEDDVTKLSTADQVVTITPGDIPGVDWSMGEQLAQAGLKATISGEMTANKLNVKILLPLANVTVLFGEDYITSGIDSPTTAVDNGVEAIYDLSGRKLNEMQKGINIVRKADGTTVKVLKK